MRIWFALILFLVSLVQSEAQYALNQDSKVNGGVYCDSSVIRYWAVKCKISRGYMNIYDTSLGLASTGDEISCIGKADNITASLGDSGVAVVSFNEPVSDISGFDFAVFENSFDGAFLELAFVEVSSDSVRWIRFPSVSQNQTLLQIGTFDNMDPTKISNLAGKYRALYGTPFDLANLKDSIGINLSNIKYVRIIDVIGAISGAHSSHDSKGNRINDPWPTPFPQSGFDLDAIAVLKSVPSNIVFTGYSNNKVYPNPVKSTLMVQFEHNVERSIRIRDLSGRLVFNGEDKGLLSEIDVSELHSGIYLLDVLENHTRHITRIVKE